MKFKGINQDQVKPIVVHDSSPVSVNFNVMKDRPVSEKFAPLEYRIYDGYIESTIDRKYQSSMGNSPDHVIFITFAIHAQRMLYIYLLEKSGIKYVPNDLEKLKIWPVTPSFELFGLENKPRIDQKLVIEGISKRADGSYLVKSSTSVGKHLRSSCSATVVYPAEAYKSLDLRNTIA